MNQSPAIGHNSLKARADELAAAANQWSSTVIADQENADLCSAFIDQLRAAAKEIEETRKKQKQPHMDAAAAVDAQYKPLAAIVEAAQGIVKPKLTAWLQKLERDRQEEERIAREKAAAAAREAQEAAAKVAAEAAKGGDVVGASVAASEAHEAALAATEEAQRLSQAPVNLKSNLGARTKALKTTYSAKVLSPAKVALHFLSDPELLALLENLASRAVRSAPKDESGHPVCSVPGIEIVAKQTAA